MCKASIKVGMNVYPFNWQLALFTTSVIYTTDCDSESVNRRKTRSTTTTESESCLPQLKYCVCLITNPTVETTGRLFARCFRQWTVVKNRTHNTVKVCLYARCTFAELLGWYNLRPRVTPLRQVYFTALVYIYI